MSRCFPFPPPGYEKKTRTENADNLTKEKNKGKKHKKEKRYKEKRENKEKRDKDKCKDKNKVKNDQKEKHKDRKKGRNKGRTSEDKIVEGQTEGHNELHIRESWLKDEQQKDSKFAEELGRTGNDRTSSSMDGSFSNSFQSKNGRIATSIASQEKERVADIKVFPVQISSTQRRNDRSGLSVEDVASSIQRTVSTSPATAFEKERSKMHDMVTVGTGFEQNRNHGEPVESISGLFNGKTEGSTAGMDKKYSCEKVFSVATRFESGKPGAKILDSSSLTSSQRRKDMANLSIRRIDGMGAISAIEKQRTRGSELFPNPVTSEQRRNGEFCKSVEKDKVLKKDKTVDKKVEDRNGHKDSDHIDKWSKAKDKCNKEKKMEEKIEKAEEVEHIELRNIGKKDQVDILISKPLAPYKDNTPCIIGIDEMLKKRKDLKDNGYLHEEDVRPYKIPRMASSFQEINGSVAEFPLAAPTSLSLKSGAMNTLKPDGILENKENKINGTTKSYRLPVEVNPRAAGCLIENGEVSLELPHPDYKYLRQIYTVPVMMEWSKIDDQDWLFNCCDSHGKILTETEAQETIHVWDGGLQIDSADVFALPYVVPF